MAAIGLQNVPSDVIKYELMSFLSSSDVASMAKTCKQMSEQRWYHHVCKEWLTEANKELDAIYGQPAPPCDFTWTVQMPWIIENAIDANPRAAIWTNLARVPRIMVNREMKVEQRRIAIENEFIRQ